MTKTQATKLQDLFLQVSQIFGEIASESVDTGSKVETTVVTDEEAVKTDSVEVVEKEEVTPSRFDELLTLKISELRSMAKGLGLDTKGTKTDIANRIANAEQVELVYDEEPEAEVEVVEAEIVEDTTDEEIDSEIEEDEELEDDEEIEDEDKSDLELLKEELEGYTEEELREVLEDVELSTKGKKQALISRIIQAVEDGIILYGDEGEETEVYAEDDFDSEIAELEAEETETEEDEDEETEEDEELSVREQVQEQISEQILEEYENGTLTDKQITKFLNEYSNGTFKTVNKKRSLNKYIEIMMELVDEDGEIVELGEPYYVGDDIAFCCGTQLKDVDGDFYCEVCGNEYEGE